MNVKKKNMTQFIYVIFLICAFGLNNHVRIVISIFMIAFLLAIDSSIIKNSEFRKWLKVFLAPCIFVHIYTFFLVLIGVSNPEILTTNLTSYTSITIGIISVFVFGLSIIRFTFIALISSWLIQLVYNIFSHGIVVLRDAILQGWLNVSVQQNYLELHDIVLAAGYFWIIYIFSNKRSKKKSGLLLLFLLIMSILGIKRIVIVAEVIVTFYYILICKLGDQKKYRLCKITGYIGMLLCILYIYILSNDNLFYDFFDTHKINLMGRNYFYDYIMSLTKFSPCFLGYGLGSVKAFMSSKFIFFSDVHSDLIKMYTEIGFVLYIIWLWYYLIHISVFLKKKYGKKAAVFNFVITIYTFVLFVTDNTESYYICTLIRTTAPICFAMGLHTSENELYYHYKKRLP